MIRGLSNSVFILLVMALFSVKSLAQGITSHPPAVVDSTIAMVILPDDETSNSSDDVVIMADSDNRRLIIDLDKKEDITRLLEAESNGWEVRLHLKPRIDDTSHIIHVIDGVHILSRENKLSNGRRRSSRAPTPALIAEDRRELNAIFNSLYPYSESHYNVEDNCYNRAHFWARTTEHNQESLGYERGTEKVFIFFTNEYQRKYNHKWWYHVAPMVYLENNNKPIVMDPTFINKPVSLNNWLATFDSHTAGNCKRIESLYDYYRESKNAVCLYAVSTMFTYVPSDLNYAPMEEWRCRDFREVMKFSPPTSKTSNRLASWSDPEFSYLTPSSCKR